MAVLVEAFSVIVRTQAIKEKHIGGFASFIKDIPNETICTDGFLVRVGFMCFDDALFYGAELIAKGLHRPPRTYCKFGYSLRSSR